MKINLAIIDTGYGLRVVKSTLGFFSNIKIKKIYSRGRKGKNITNNLNDILEDKLIKFICIETPPNTHLDLIKKFYKKKIIFCEKPLVHNRKALNKIKNLFKSKNCNIIVNHQLRFHPKLILFKKMIKSLEKINGISVEYYSNNFKEKKNWWLDQNKGGGHLLAIGPHLIDLISFFGRKITKCKVQKNFSKKFNKKIDTSFKIDGYLSNLIPFEIKSSCICKLKQTRLNIVVKHNGGTLIFNNFKNIKLNNKLIKNKLFTKKLVKDKFFVNEWRIAQYFFYKNYLSKGTLKADDNLLNSIKNLEKLI